MKQLRNIVAPIFLLCLMAVASLPALAQEQQEDVTPQEQKENTVNVKEIVFGHIGDSYEWHITTWGKTHITIPLPIIVYSSATGWHTFLSSRLAENGGTYEGLSIAPEGSKYEAGRVQCSRRAGSPVGYFHNESDVCSVVQQCAIAGNCAECGALVQETSAGGIGTGRLHRIHGNVYHDGERRYHQELCRTQLPEVRSVSADCVFLHFH